MADVVYKYFLAASTESVRYLRLAVFELPHSHSVFSINTPRMPPHTRSRGCEGAWRTTIAYHSVCLPTSWPVFQNDDFFPNNKFSVWPHVMKYVSLGTTKLNDSDPLSIG